MRKFIFLISTLMTSAIQDAAGPVTDAATGREAVASSVTVQSLGVGIYGTRTMGVSEMCTFTSAVSGGVAPYTYAWSTGTDDPNWYLTLDNPSGASVDATATVNGWPYADETRTVSLSLVVTDANGLQGGTGRRVKIVANGWASC